MSLWIVGLSQQPVEPGKTAVLSACPRALFQAEMIESLSKNFAVEGLVFRRVDGSVVDSATVDSTGAVRLLCPSDGIVELRVRNVSADVARAHAMVIGKSVKGA